MAKKKSKSSGERVHIRNANQRLSRAALRFRPFNLLAVEDGRIYSPEPSLIRPALNLAGRPSRISLSAVESKQRQKQTKSRLTFVSPFETVLCLRRGVRREVLFARAGFGRKIKKIRRRRRNKYSSISCKG